MKLLIYRDYEGKKYPAFLVRFLLAALIVVFSFYLLNGTLMKADFKSSFWFRYLFIVIVQEWIFLTHLGIASRFYDPFAIWKYAIVQIVLGVLLPTLLILRYSTQLYQGTLLNSTRDELARNDMALFFPQTVIGFNILFSVCLFARTGYTRLLTVPVKNGETTFPVGIIILAIVNEEDILFAIEDSWLIANATADLKSALNDLDPKDFENWQRRIYLNKNTPANYDKQNVSALVDKLRVMNSKDKRDFIDQSLKNEIGKIKKEKAKKT